MIAYRIRRDGAEATVRLAISNMSSNAPLVLEGDPALAQELRHRLMHHFQVTVPRFAAIQGMRLNDWMFSQVMRDLGPTVVEGAEIVRYGGTYSQDDCMQGAELIASKLAALATYPRTPIWEGVGTYDWQNIIEGRVMSSMYELRVWRRVCEPVAGSIAPVEDALAAELVRRKAPAEITAARVLAAFEPATDHGAPDKILADFWFRLYGWKA